MDEIISVFIQESREQLAEMEAGLLQLEQNPNDHDNINAIFRAAHTIKGGSGVIECHFIEAFTHRVENVLDALRNGELHVSGPLATLLLGCCDHMVSLIDVLAAEAAEPPEELKASGDALTARLTVFLDSIGGPSAEAGGAELAVQDDDAAVEASGGGIVLNDS